MQWVEISSEVALLFEQLQVIRFFKSFFFYFLYILISKNFVSGQIFQIGFLGSHALSFYK